MRLDARGRESRTLFFVAVSIILVWAKFIVAGIKLPMLGVMPPMTAGEFGSAVVMILAAWVGREWVKKGD